MSGQNIARTLECVIFAAGLIHRYFASLGGPLEKPLQERSTPPAACAGPKALAHLARAAGTLHPDKVHNFPLGDMETQANFVVQFHEQMVGSNLR